MGAGVRRTMVERSLKKRVDADGGLHEEKRYEMPP
jgi:hypothetical protein